MHNKEKILHFFILLPYIWLATGLLAYKSGDKGMLIMIILSIIATFIAHRFSTVKANLTENKTLYVLFAITAYAVFCYFYHGMSSREVRCLLASSLILVFFPRELLTEKLLRYLTLLGAVTCFIYTAYYALYSGLSRSEWSINAIPYATLTAVFGLFALAQLFDINKSESKIIPAIIVLLSISTLFINQTRGILLAFFLTVFLLIFLVYKGKSINWKKIVISCGVLILIAFSVRTQIQTNLSRTQIEIENITKGNLNTSIGLRLQMWKIAPLMIENNYLLGLGDAHSARVNTLYEQGYVHQSLYEFNPRNYHNQFIDHLIKHGVIGLAVLMLWMLYPLFRLNNLTTLQKNSVIAFISLITIASVTDVPLHHGQMILMYCLLVYGFTSMKPAKKETAL